VASSPAARILHRVPAPPNCTGVQCKARQCERRRHSSADCLDARRRPRRKVAAAAPASRFSVHRSPPRPPPAPRATPRPAPSASRATPSSAGPPPWPLSRLHGAVVRRFHDRAPHALGAPHSSGKPRRRFHPSRGGVFPDDLDHLQFRHVVLRRRQHRRRHAAAVFAFARDAWWRAPTAPTSSAPHRPHRRPTAPTAATPPRRPRPSAPPPSRPRLSLGSKKIPQLRQAVRVDQIHASLTQRAHDTSGVSAYLQNRMSWPRAWALSTQRLRLRGHAGDSGPDHFPPKTLADHRSPAESTPAPRCSRSARSGLQSARRAPRRRPAPPSSPAPGCPTPITVTAAGCTAHRRNASASGVVFKTLSSAAYVASASVFIVDDKQSSARRG